jgi:hypothetical protein
MQRVESRLRGELQQEQAAVQAAVAADNTGATREDAIIRQSASPPLEQAVCEPERDDIPRPPAPPVKPGDSTRIGRRIPSPVLIVDDRQRPSIATLTRLKTTAPDEPPTPRARAP